VGFLARSDRLILVGSVLVLGVIIGLVVTLHHRSLPPLGVVVALMIVAAWGAALRLMVPGRALTLAGLLAALGAQFVLTAGSTTSIIVGQGLVGYVFTLGTVLIAVVVLAWPETFPSGQSVE
jgi:hypothetical protein